MSAAWESILVGAALAGGAVYLLLRGWWHHANDEPKSTATQARARMQRRKAAEKELPDKLREGGGI